MRQKHIKNNEIAYFEWLSPRKMVVVTNRKDLLNLKKGDYVAVHTDDLPNTSYWSGEIDTKSKSGDKLNIFIY